MLHDTPHPRVSAPTTGRLQRRRPNVSEDDPSFGTVVSFLLMSFRELSVVPAVDTKRMLAGGACGILRNGELA